MRRVLGLAIAIGGAGCAAILGIEDKPIREDVEAGTVEACARAVPPPPTGVDDDKDTERQYVVGIRSLALRPPAGGVLGFDLDGTCSYDGGTCTSSAGIDKDGGIDNGLGDLPFVEVLSLDGGLENENVACGRATLIAVLVHYNGRANDADVQIGFAPSPGLEQPHEEGEAPSTDCNDDPSAPRVYPARWDGTDQWSLAGPYVFQGDTIPQPTLPAYVRDHTLVVQTAQNIVLPIGPFPVDVAQATIVARIVPLDERLQATTTDAPASFVRLEGQAAGRIAVDPLFRGVHNAPASSRYGQLCPGNPVYGLFRDSVCGGLDIMASAAEDRTGRPCNALSMAAGFTAEPVRVSKAGPPRTLPPSPCADAPTACP